MNYTERIPCPVCKSSEAKTARTSRDIVQCDSCGIVYLRTRPPVKELEAWYQRYASNPGSHMKCPETFDQVRTTPLRRNDLMSDLLGFVGPERRQFIDCGSGWGAFLHNAREHDFAVTGIEICREMADFATSMLGIYTHRCQLEETDLLSDGTQVVSLCHSLEHLPDTASALGYIHRILEPNGIICGIVPNFAGWGSITMREKWPWIDADYHYTHYSPETLKTTLWRFGFNTLKMYTTTGDFDRKLLPTGASLARLEADGKGEEIHWIAQKL
jgi:SAM-dependent methyltransferase